MMTPMRTIIELPPHQLDALDALCRRDGLSRAEAIRRAVEAHLGRESRAARASAYGLWRGRKIDGLAWERRLRSEWTASARRK
jgi:hypothetical protein